MRALVVALTAIAVTPVFAQTSNQTTPQTTPPQRPHKVLTPEQIAWQQASKEYDSQIAKLRAAAVAAYNAEMVREKAPECPNADTTYAINMCLAHENEITDANYKVVTTNLRAMLALPAPPMPGMPDPIMGPSGPEATPATDTAAFDKAEAAWQVYAAAECGDAVDTHWRGGTIVNAMDVECSLRLARARMHELDEVYNITHPM